MRGIASNVGEVTTAREIVDTMTLDQKIGQVLCTSVGHHSSVQISPGGTVRASDAHHRRALLADCNRVAEEVERYQLGGVCYFPGRPDGNLPEDVAEITGTLQRAAPLALLVSTDQEGGNVARLRRGFTAFGSAMSMAALGDPAAVRDAAAVSGREKRAVGINHVFSPVADVNSNPANPVIGTRSYGSDPARVAECVVAAISGYRDAGVAATVKHFPGHGDTATDSHLGLPVVGRTEAEWRRYDQPTFTAAIAAGVDAVMSGHLVLRWAAPDGTDVPATYSAPILTDLLRTEMGFAGLVVSDALEMTGAVQGRDPATAPVDALLAGVDQLLMPVDIPATVAALKHAVDGDRVPMQRLDQACQRVLVMKERLGLLAGASVGHDLTGVGAGQLGAVQLAAQAVTVLGPAFVAPSAGRLLAVVGSDPAAGNLARALERHGRVVRGADDAFRPDAAVFVVSSDLRRGGELDQVRQLLEAYPNPVLIVAGSPYGAEAIGGHRTVLLSYGDTAVHIEGLAVALTDPSRPPAGQLPVRLIPAP